MPRTPLTIEGFTPGMVRNLVDGYKESRGDGAMFDLPEGLETDEEILQWLRDTYNPNLGSDAHDDEYMKSGSQHSKA